MKRKVLGIGFLLMAGTLFAQAPQQHGVGTQFGGINLSIWKRMSTQPVDTVGSTWLNVGIYSSMNKLNGLSVNGLASTVKGSASGLQVAGLACLTAESMNGVQLSGIANVNGDRMRGISIAGLVNIAGDQCQGITLSGLASITGDETHGISLGGLLNINGENAKGLQVGGLANISGNHASGIGLGGAINVVGDDFNGLQMSGLLNVTGTEARGIQLAGAANVTGESVRGIQLAGLANVVGSSVRGLQIAPFNASKRVNGLQIGLVNYYKETLRGAQIGLVNLSPRTRHQWIISGGNTSYFDTGVRFKNQRFYTILGMGTGHRHLGHKFSASLFYRAGLELPLYRALSVSGDLGYRHIESFDNKHHGQPARLYALQARLNLHCRLSQKVGLFATGGYGGSRLYNHNSTHDKGMIWEAGLLIF